VEDPIRHPSGPHTGTCIAVAVADVVISIDQILMSPMFMQLAWALRHCKAAAVVAPLAAACDESMGRNADGHQKLP